MSKRRGDCHTSSNRKQKACKSIGKTNSTFEEEFKTTSDTDQVSCGGLGDQVLSGLSRCVVALASFNGEQMHYACTGTVLKNTGSGISILTSGDLVRSPDDATTFMRVRIEVRLPNHECAIRAWMNYYDFKYNVAVINMKYCPDVVAAYVNPDFKIGCRRKVVAAGLDFLSGKFMTTCGRTAGETSGLSPEELMISTCKITKCYIGGPLFDSRGNFVGTNFYGEEMTPFIPFNIICKHLVHAGAIWLTSLGKTLRRDTTLQANRVGIKQARDNTTERHTSEVENYNVPSVSALEGTSSGKSQNNDEIPYMRPRRDAKEPVYYEIVDTNIERRATFVPLPANEFTASLAKKLGPQGYPMPITLEGGMRLLHTFEKEFAQDIWSTLTKKVAVNTSRSVVSLASFCGETRFFACTGVLIGRHKSTTRVLTSASLVRKVDSNEIADNLTIQVYLPNNQRAKGTLQYCNMHHNIALISIRGFHCRRTAKFKQVQEEPGKEVIAIGRVFETGKLMATSGVLTGESKPDCRQLMISTCKITKAGIGGPLIDFDGNFIGMNFYDSEETPYLPRSTILELLKQVDGKGISDKEVIDKAGLYQWPVPEPCWHYPSTIVRVYRPCRRKF